MTLRSSAFSSSQRLQSAARNSPPLRRGDRGDAVRSLQEVLANMGFAMPRSTRPDGTMDGIFGGEVVDQLREFQRVQDIGVDGIAGNETLHELDAIVLGEAEIGRRQDESFFDPYQKAPNPGEPVQPIARVFFPTNEHTLAGKDRETLVSLARFYRPVVRARRPGRSVKLVLVGYADHRGSEASNAVLARRRASAVKAFIDPIIAPGGSLVYASQVRSRGEVPPSGDDLAADRRVDVYSNYIPERQQVIDFPPHVFPSPTYTGPLGSRFEMRTVSGGASGVVVGATMMVIDVRSTRHRKVVRYAYLGGGGNVGFPSFNRPTGWSEVDIRYDDPRDAARAWFKAEDLEGAGTIEAAGGLRVRTVLTFEGPMERGRTLRPVRIEIEGWDFALGWNEDVIGRWVRIDDKGLGPSDTWTGSGGR